MAIQSLVNPSSKRPLPHNGLPARIRSFISALQSNLQLSTWLLIGACLQSLLVLLLPSKYALTPAVALLLFRTIDTVLITTGAKPNPYLEGVLMKKTTAQVMNGNGEFPGLGKEKVAILLLGAKSNHPLGLFAPDFNTVGGYLQEMTRELESENDQDTGFLGQTGWERKDANGATEFIFISYWRSLDAVHAYAHGTTHRKALQWWEKTLKSHNHIGFMHEVFEAPRGQWESVYINFQPTLLGATTYLKRGGELEAGKVGDEWVSPLLDANRGLMRTSAGRRGQTHKEADQDMFGENAYVG